MLTNVISTKCRQHWANTYNQVKICLSSLHPSLEISVFNILIQYSTEKHTYWINTLLSTSLSSSSLVLWLWRIQVMYNEAHRLEMKAREHCTQKSRWCIRGCLITYLFGTITHHLKKVVLLLNCGEEKVFQCFCFSVTSVLYVRALWKLPKARRAPVAT